MHAVKPDDTAFIQFSSGSTSEPKGVVLTHRNILTNARGAGEASHWNENDVNLTWMPLTHDMGLIGMHIMMFAHRMQLNVMPTELFIRRPLLWMTFASRKRATVTELAELRLPALPQGARRSRPSATSTCPRVRLIYNGAEPISVELARRIHGAPRARETARARRCTRCTAWPKPRWS